MGVWDGTFREPEARWHKWWAWYPVKIACAEGFAAITFFEEVWRREVDGRWEYQLCD